MPEQEDKVETGKLALALSKAQATMKGAKKDAENPFFKSTYADLASVWDACRGPLSENELSVTQVTDIMDGALVLKTILLHSSGESITGILPVMVGDKATAQQVGSAITYARRYALSAIVGIAPEDDDGNSASEQQASTRINKSSNLVEEAKKYASEIELADTEEKLSILVNRYATMMGKLSKELPKWHGKLLELLAKQRTTFQTDIVQ